MIRFAIPPIGGKGWFGGWMYMQNLVRALAMHGDPEIETLLFVGPDRSANPEVRALADLPRTRVVTEPAFGEDRVRRGVGRVLATGLNTPVLSAYARASVDVALAPAMYLGWRSEIPSLAWIPDFQHHHLPHMFSRRAWWKRELGFRAQIASSTSIILSSDDAERDCLKYYPAAKRRTTVARFAVSVDDWPDADQAASILQRAGIPDDFVFLPNQLWQHKNHGLAIEAAALLAKRGSNRMILASGHGSDPRFPGYSADLDAQIIATGAGNNIRMLGSVDHRLVQAMMVCTNALLNPSLFEGWSTTVEEAKAVGTPLLLSDLRVHREQAPEASFFATGGAAALADAVEAATPRSGEEIRKAIEKARTLTDERQHAFAAVVSNLVRNAARNTKRTDS